MKLTISIESTNQIISVDIPGLLTVQDFKAYLEAETDVAPNQQILVHNGKTLHDETKTLEDAGVANDDLIVLLSPRPPAPAPAPAASDADAQVEFMRNKFLLDPAINERLRTTNPQLHATLEDPVAFRQAIMDTASAAGQGFGGYNASQQEELRRLQENPDEPANQARILEIIRQEQIDQNMQLAYDISPESFTSVNMLYVDISVNGHKVQAFVDSGAQVTIISPRLAAEVGIEHLIDKRFQGEARGVGSQPIMGKIHSVPIAIGDSTVEIPCSFMVIDTSVDLLFGLDMMRRHKCVIDLQRDVLTVGGGHIETKFLLEAEIKKPFGEELQPGRAPTGLGGNIFSDATIPTRQSSAPGTAAHEAALKRQKKTEPSPFKPEDIERLVSLGFSKQQAINALELCNGNVEMAASLLFQ